MPTVTAPGVRLVAEFLYRCQGAQSYEDMLAQVPRKIAPLSYGVAVQLPAELKPYGPELYTPELEKALTRVETVEALAHTERKRKLTALVFNWCSLSGRMIRNSGASFKRSGNAHGTRTRFVSAVTAPAARARTGFGELLKALLKSCCQSPALRVPTPAQARQATEGRPMAVQRQAGSDLRPLRVPVLSPLTESDNLN